MDAADIPNKEDRVRSGLFKAVFDPKHEYSADEWNALRDGILDLRTGGVGATADIITDELDGTGEEWTVFRESGTAGAAFITSTVPGLSYAFRGCAVMVSGDASANDSLSITRHHSPIVLSADAVVLQFRVGSEALVLTGDIFSGALAVYGAHCSWWTGIKSASGGPGTIALVAKLNIDGNRTGHALVTITADETSHVEELTTPLPAGAYVDIRFTITTSGTKVEASAEDGDFVTLVEGAVAPTSGLVYLPFVRIQSDATGVSRWFVVDRFRHIRGGGTGDGEMSGLPDVAYMATPATHGAQHTGDGADSIPNATTSSSGAMGSADKIALNAATDELAALDSPAREKKTASFTADVAVGYYLIDTTAGAVVVELPLVVEHGWILKKISTDTNKITVSPGVGAFNIEAANAAFDLPGSDGTGRPAYRVDGSLVSGAVGWWVA